MLNSFINKACYTLFIILFSTINCVGQDVVERDVNNKLAVVLNGNVGSVMPFPFSNVPDDASADMMIRPFVGIQLNRPLSPNLYLKLSAMYSNKSVGFNTTLKNQLYNGYIEQNINGKIVEGYIEDAYFTGVSSGFYKLQYVETNLSIAAKMSDKGAVYLGIYFAYLLNGENEIIVDGTISLAPDIPPISDRFERTEDYASYINKSDFGFQIGIERKIYKKINGNIQLSSGLHSIYNSGLEAIDFTMLNMYLAFGFTYYLGHNIFL